MNPNLNVRHSIINSIIYIIAATLTATSKIRLIASLKRLFLKLNIITFIKEEFIAGFV